LLHLLRGLRHCFRRPLGLGLGDGPQRLGGLRRHLLHCFAGVFHLAGELGGVPVEALLCSGFRRLRCALLARLLPGLLRLLALLSGLAGFGHGYLACGELFLLLGEALRLLL